MKRTLINSFDGSYDRPLTGYIVTVFKVVFILAMSLIIYESLIAANSSPALNHFDKIVHFVAYFALVVLGLCAFPKAHMGWIVGTMIVLGTGLEAAQGLMGLGRSASFGDLIANTLGAVFPACLWGVFIRLTTSPEA